MEVINLNLIPSGALPVVHASQYDEGRTFRANLMDGSTVYTLDGTEVLECDVKKPDGNIVTVAVTNTSDSYVEIDTTLQMCACAGESLAELHITKGAQEIGTLNFILAVERSPLENGIQSDSAIHNLASQVSAMVATEVASQYDSANVIFDNAPTAGHGNGYAVTSEGIGNAIDNALDMTDTASGSIATFDTSLALPLQNCTIEINAVQEAGTPTPSSPKAITGFTGANITNHGKNYLDTSTNVNGKALSATGAETSISQACYTDLIKVVVGEKYTFGATSALADAWNRRIHGYDASGNWVQEIMNSNAQSYAVGTPFTMTFTVPSGISYIRISYYKDTNAQLEKGESASAYQAYNSTTTAITWQDEAGTVYGGSLDVTSGVLTVTHLIKDLGDLTWVKTGMSEGHYGFRSTISDMELTPYSNLVANIICSAYPSLSGNNVYLGNEGISGWGAGTHDIAIYDASLESGDAIAFKTAVAGFDLVYKIATPVTYQLTPTQISAIVGTNNVFTDTNGDTSLEYYTKRGEQTVRIAEGVAVDVINNESIDTLSTTNKTVVGAINELDGDIGDLSTLTTTDKSSLVGAINAKADKFKIDSFNKGSLSLSANGATTFNNSFITVPTGYSIGGVIDFSCGDIDICAVNIQPSNTSNFAFVLKNISSSAKSNITFTIKLLFVATGSIIT